MVEMLQTLFPQAVSISAKTGYGIEQLTSTVAKLYKGDEVEVQVTARQANGRVRGFLHRYGTVVSEAYSNGFVFFEVRLGKNLVAGVRGLGAEVTEVVY
jgi:50S ribosomal subunit-associated GTPase HflX